MNDATSGPRPRRTTPATAADSVSWGVRVAAAWSWRLLLVLVAAAALVYLLAQLSEVAIPVAVSLLLAALLTPLVSWMQRHHVARGPATAIALVGGIAVVAAVLTFVVRAFINGLSDLTDEVSRSVDQVQTYLVDGPLNLEQSQIDGAFTSVTDGLSNNRDAITSGALNTATSFGHFVSGAAIALFTTIFLVYDGARIWSFLLRFVPSSVRTEVHTAGNRGFASLVGYVRATVAVAAVDAIGIGVGLAVLQVSLALPLAALVFLGAFVPIIGAFISGLVAVAVALVTQGLVVALIVLGIIIGVQQLEAHVLQPLLLGRAVQLHPLAVVLAIAVGLVVAGVIGALLAVPLVAVLNSAVHSLAEGPDAHPATIDPTDPDAALPGDGDGDAEGQAERGAPEGPVPAPA